MAYADGSDVHPDCTFGPNGQSVQVEHTLGAYIGAIRPAPMPLVVDTFPLWVLYPPIPPQGPVGVGPSPGKRGSRVFKFTPLLRGATYTPWAIPRELHESDAPGLPLGGTNGRGLGLYRAFAHMVRYILRGPA